VADWVLALSVLLFSSMLLIMDDDDTLVVASKGHVRQDHCCINRKILDSVMPVLAYLFCLCQEVFEIIKAPTMFQQHWKNV
jgi:hypothetical protein